MMEFYDYYDAIDICEKSSEAHYKSAYGIRNRYMVENSDLVVCYVKNRGGAYNAMKHAEKLKVKIINIAEEDD